MVEFICAHCDLVCRSQRGLTKHARARHGASAVCAVADCDKRCVGRGLCSLHYDRAVRGRPLEGPVRTPRKCRRCGTDFLAGRNLGRGGSYPRFCSDPCRRARARRLPKRCAHCGVMFEPRRTGPVALFCNANCGDAARNPRNTPTERECATCGTPFISVQPHQRRCSKICRDTRQRNLSKRKYAHQSGSTHRRRARRFGVAYEYVSPVGIFERDGWVCGICSAPVERTIKYPDPKSASLDHVVPMSRGGAHAPENLQCSHLECNLRARDKAA